MFPITRAVLDASVLIDAESRGTVPWSIQRRAGSSRELIITTPVLTQIGRGGFRQAALCRFLKCCVLASPSAATAERAGELLGRAGTGDVVDALVVATAIEMAAATIFTRDPGDLRALLDVTDAPALPLIQKV
jgi:hypothetical protein